MPPSVTTIEKMPSPIIHHSKLIPEIEETARAPKYMIDVRFTNTYTQPKHSHDVLTVSLYRC